MPKPVQGTEDREAQIIHPDEHSAVEWDMLTLVNKRISQDCRLRSMRRCLQAVLELHKILADVLGPCKVIIIGGFVFIENRRFDQVMKKMGGYKLVAYLILPQTKK